MQVIATGHLSFRQETMAFNPKEFRNFIVAIGLSGLTGAAIRVRACRLAEKLC